MSASLKCLPFKHETLVNPRTHVKEGPALSVLGRQSKKVWGALVSSPAESESCRLNERSVSKQKVGSRTSIYAHTFAHTYTPTNSTTDTQNV